MKSSHAALALLALAPLALPTPARADDPPPLAVEAGPEAQERLQEALILAAPGQVVQLGAGTFELTSGLSLAVARVTVRGQGPEQTVLSFAKQEAGGEGLLVTADGVLLEGFTVRATPGDAIKVRGAHGITFRRVRAEWPGAPSAKNGGYGLYPVSCSDVLIEDCSARGASDSGIYVGQSRRVIVRRCRVEECVAGIEIENSREVDVYENTATKNTGGILVFDLPGLPVKGGGQVRVFKNTVVGNETPNFAPEGNVVRTVPRGTGLVVMANRGVELFENEVGQHSTTNVLVTSYLVTGLPLTDAEYDPFPEGVHVHHNKFGPCGQAPDGPLGLLAAGAVGLPLPSVVWDGVVDPRRLVDGELPPERRIVLGEGNGEGAELLVLDLQALMQDPEHAHPRRLQPGHSAPLAPLPAVTLEGAR